MSDHDPSNQHDPTTNSDDIKTAWSASAADLARWTMERLVVRCDVWGGYVRVEERGKEYTDSNGKAQKLGSTITRPSSASIRGGPWPSRSKMNRASRSNDRICSRV